MKIIAVTGGDVSGKTDSWRRLPTDLKAKVLQVPEIATALMGAGKALPALGIDIEVQPETLQQYQGVFRLAQLVAEDSWRMVAAAEGKKLVWCDRGIPDLVAYEQGGWPAVEQAFGMTKQEIYDRYDHVIVLRSLANYDPERYLQIQKENPSRTPRSVEEVLALDERTRSAWADHPGLIEVDGSRGIDEVVRQIAAVVRELTSKEIEKKFLLRELPDLSQFQRVVRVFQRQGYLIAKDDVEQRLRRAAVENGPIEYFHTVKGDGTVSRSEYEDPNLHEWAFEALWGHIVGHPIEKIRHLSLWQGVIYEIDHYQQPGQMFVVEANFSSEDEAAAFVLPEWMANAIDVTDDKRFKAKNIARNGIPDLSELW